MLLYNDRFFPEHELKLPLCNRAFQYNDGFFETIMISDGRLRFWQDHQERMREAALTLKLHLPDVFFSPEFESRLLELAQHCQAAAHGRLKMKVWRAGAGLYTPQTNEVDWLVTAQPAGAVSAEPIRVAICQQIQTQPSPLSHFKGPNALLYVLAGIEKQERGMEDMLLLSPQQMVSELISSNIFWISGEVLSTPALETGCVNGILRRNILRHCKTAGIEVQEVYTGMEKLQQAEAAFAANVTGLRVIGAIEDKVMQLQHPLIRQLRQAFS